ncbi:hypothetical protein ASPZODRAFT_129788 [Penicilliopsis zonata CBS 506.65]|uniref:PH domain-containing protein n=1 Tax=Penicilliopsis zonata CBS 506.65 TaxID=1073090 RepID=A0A1L9SQ56_9EURO|nr:hypothetical protein ASPZODRAFT_129788 [Penicilliopsis zonata CBS 506.65]OJJ49350.1 hypothetical protein ASPZODRAFT_129788 [Penicilliopsis zonata CBS 506.65]
MSDVQKPVEETPVAAPAVETPVESAPAAEPATEAPVETPAETTAEAPAEVTETPAEAPKEESKEEAKKEEEAKEVTPATDGVLGYKGPGLVKGLRFTKRYLYFQDEAVEPKNLAAFLQSEKAAVACPIAAWASQTGKGLLFVTKRSEDKATPAGIFNLAEISDLAKEGHNELLFKISGHKHTFQASSAAERDSWYAALEAKSAEAQAEKETITGSEGYKAELEKLTKPVVAEPVQKKAEDKKEEETAPVAAAAAAPAPAPVAEEKEKAPAKSRSQSRKRASIFGSFLGKKEEAEKKEEKPEEAKAVEPVAEIPTEAAPVAEVPAVPAVAAEETPVAVPAVETAEKEEKKAETPVAQKKRASIFGNFFQKVTSPSHEKSEKEATAPAEPAAVSSTAPQLENPVEEAAVAPIEPESVTAPAETAAATAEAAETPAEAAPAEAPAAAATSPAPKDKRRTSFFGNLGIKKEKKGETSDNEATDGETKHKSNKLGGIFRMPSKAVKLGEKKETATAETETKPEPISKDAPETAAEETPKPAETTETAAPAAEAAEPVEPVNVASASTPVQAAA